MTEPLLRSTAAAPNAPAQVLAALPVAVAALDGDLCLTWANPAFERLLEPARGQALGAVVQLDDSLLPVAEQVLRGRTASGVPVELHLARSQGGYVASVRSAARDAQAEALQQVLLKLSREVVAARSEEEIVGALARAVRALFPGASYCVRVVDPRTYALTALHAEGALGPQARVGIALKRAAAEKMGLEVDELPPERVQVVDDVPWVFVGSARGFSTPLIASGQLFGVLDVEFPPGDSRDGQAEERSMLRAANHAAAALRNTKLFEEVSSVRRYLESLIEHANALIVVINPEGRLIVANAEAHRLFGRAPGGLLGVELIELVGPDDRERVAHALELAARGGPPATFEAVFASAAGRPVRVGFSTAAVRATHGGVEGVIAVGQDLTLLRGLEQQVIQAEKLASLGQLAAGVAHEINNPLTTIAIYADALLQKHAGPLASTATSPAVGGVEAADLDKLQRIREASDRILKLARDLTSYARPSSDVAEPVELTAVLEQSVAFCDHVIKAHEVVLHADGLAGLPRVLGVRSNLIQVFVNLLTNACHATAAGGSLEIRAARAGPFVAVHIRDTGTGIAPDDLAQIFEPFFTTKPAGEGTGLGLSIVQGIVRKHGGRIGVQSALGQGTEFVVELPLAEATEAAEAG